MDKVIDASRHDGTSPLGIRSIAPDAAPHLNASCPAHANCCDRAIRSAAAKVATWRRCTSAAIGLGWVVGSAVAATAGGPASPDALMKEPLRLPAGYRLVWSDEFSTDGLPDATKWVYDTGMNKQGWHNAELQYYSDARPENSVVRDGKLLITARKEDLSARADWGGQKYSSARLITRGKGDWTYGFYEIRAKLPCGLGTWPAIWMLNTPVEWPAGGEIDIVEHIGREPGHVFSTLHTAAGHGAHGTGNGTQVPDACTAFHDYQLHWTPHHMRFGIDGQVHHVYRNARQGTAQWPFDAPEFLILNIAIGGHLGGPVDDAIFPVQMEVDHVRVYQAPR